MRLAGTCFGLIAAGAAAVYVDWAPVTFLTHYATTLVFLLDGHRDEIPQTLAAKAASLTGALALAICVYFLCGGRADPR